MNISMREGLTFDDVLLLPGYADFKRQDVDLTTVLHPKLPLKLPVISSPMDTVTEEAMARALASAGGLGIIHRNLSIETQAGMVKRIKKDKMLVGAAVGVGGDLKERVKALAKEKVDVVVLDSGHGNTKFMAEAVSFIKKNYPDVILMAGNIATADGAKRLVSAGADILRVGMGPGSICTTRIVTGMGVPQLTAIMEAVKGAGGSATIVADGGIRQIGDMAKAIAAGAAVVMLGSLFAGYDESPTKIVVHRGKTYKAYRGMGSVTSMQKGSAQRYGQTSQTDRRKLIPEGVEGLVPYKGRVGEYLEQVAGSLRSSFYYIGAATVAEFQRRAAFIRITGASLTESHPHTITLVDAGRNYTV